MTDLKAPDKVFKASAFEPSEEDIQVYKRNRRSPSTSDESKKSRGTLQDVPDKLESDSDDDLPDVAHMLGSKTKGGRGANVITSDDESDVTEF